MWIYNTVSMESLYVFALILWIEVIVEKRIVKRRPLM